MEQPEIVADGLRLRPWRAADAADVHRACQDPDIQRWTQVPTPYLWEHATSFVTTINPRAWADGTAAHFAVCDPVTGALLGSCGLVSIDRNLRSAEVGYWTAPWARGRGVAVRAIRALGRWAFDELRLRRLVWQAELGNHASRLVALRAGFRVEGRLRLAGAGPDSGPEGWVGSLLPDELTPPPDRGDDRSGRTAADPPAPANPTADPPAPANSTAEPPTDASQADHPPYGAGWPGSIEARRAAVFGRPQPVLTAAVGGTALRLRPLADRDLDDIVAACRDPESVRWTSVPDPYQHWHGEWFVHGYATRHWAAGSGAVFAITGPDDRYAGVIDLRVSPAEPLVADLGFLVAPYARGRGYCPAGLVAVCGWGFTTLGLTRIEWRANLGNVASRRAAEKAGFVLEGTARRAINQRGVPTDAWVGALIPEDLGLPGTAGAAVPDPGSSDPRSSDPRSSDPAASVGSAGRAGR